MLQPESITTTEAGKESYGYTVSDTREYPNLDRNDCLLYTSFSIKLFFSSGVGSKIHQYGVPFAVARDVNWLSSHTGTSGQLIVRCTKRGSRANIHSPVSYTHLDVYKRQVVHRAGRARRAAADIADTGADP